MICNKHFCAENFTSFERQRLLPDAVPIDYRQLDNAIHCPFDPSSAVRVYGKNDRAIKQIEKIQLHKSLSVSRQSQGLGGKEEVVDSFELNIPSPSRVQSPEIDDPSGQTAFLELETNREMQLEVENKRLHVMFSKVVQQLSDIKRISIRREEIPKNDNDMDLQTFLASKNITNDTRKAMSELQMRSDNCRQPYTETQKLLALKWHFYSASCYERMRQTGL